METMLANWRELPLQTQQIIFDIGKLALLVIITLACINKIRQRLISFELDNCFRLPPLDKKKPAPTPKTLWLSTCLAYGVSLSIAGVLSNEFIMHKPLWAGAQNVLLVKFWGVIVFYLLLICLLKQFLIALSELFKTPKIENFIESFLGDTGNSTTRYQSTSLSAKIIHFSTFAIYYGIAWIIALMLLVELFNLQLFSSLIISLFVSTGELFVALLMLFLGFRFYTRQADKDAKYIKQSNLVLVCCVLLGSLIIGGSSILISSIPWLFLLIALWFFLMRPDKENLSDFIAGIYLRLRSPLVTNETNRFKINELGFFESEITHSSGEQEIINNSKLLSICSNVDNEVVKDS
ncbi:MAG: hypothetical protein GQ583_08690 [Methyloprofundus sp.]|nr:hypothetical protein [Methyloprofundus sp.]